MQKIVHFNKDAIQKMEKRFRANFINSVTGYKSANLIGTVGNQGRSNLAVFSSITHLGSHPPLLGFITRPTSVSRHTYSNIKENHSFTVNHIHSGIIHKAHQTAARYEANVSEFTESALTEEFLADHKAPFVMEAHIKIACEYVNEYPIQENGTVLIVGAMHHVYVPETSFTSDGWIDLQKTDGVTVSGLDSYSKPALLDRFSYAKPDKDVTSILRKE